MSRPILLIVAMVRLVNGAGPDEFFEMRVRPLLAANCLGCHAGSKMGGLDMTSRESMLKGGNSGPAIVEGNPQQSLLLRVVRREHDRIKMPPQGKLKEEDIETLAAWVKAGAPWSVKAPTVAAPANGKFRISPEQRAFWSFQPVRKQPPPAVRNRNWVASPIDSFVLARLEAKRLQPMARADKRTLLRRATYDLTGLPPTPEEMQAFLKDDSAEAFSKVVDRLLDSPRYGERWARHWLDVARYADDKLQAIGETPQRDAFRFRNWVIDAFNSDMPYDRFVKAQIAGDLLPESDKTIAGLGLYALSPELQDDRVDVTTRGFLGLTVGCAQCHNHKYDPIPTGDYYALLGIFNNTEAHDAPLAEPATVAEYQRRKTDLETAEKRLKDFVHNQAVRLADAHASRIVEYLPAAFDVISGGIDAETVASRDSLDLETLQRWLTYLRDPLKEHPYLKPWDALLADKRSPESKRAEVQAFAQQFQATVLRVIAEKRKVDDENIIIGGGATDRFVRFQIHFKSLPRDEHMLWREVLSERIGNRFGMLYYEQDKLERFLSGEWKRYLGTLRRDVKAKKQELPEKYPFLYTIRDKEKRTEQRVHVRGDANNPGELAPPRFLSILSNSQIFTKGSGRLELAEAIASPTNPLTARVMVNRIWQGHFGEGIVRTPSNFGQLGERPTHPELLDWLAARFVENKWSIKTMHREIMLSSTYALSATSSVKNEAVDPGNILLWRANRRRLDAEAIRDSLLFVSGKLDLTTGGPGAQLDAKNFRRTIYGYVSRKRLDPVLALFDFPNPNATSEQRITTNVPLQGLFFLNSPLMTAQAERVAERFEKLPVEQGIREVYRHLFGREASTEELRLGREFLKRPANKAWEQYVSVLMSSHEFLYLS